MAKLRKNGPITQEEKNFISANMRDMSPSDIAEELGRNPETITKFIGQMDDGGFKGDILNLKKREDWPMICKQLSAEEIELFSWHWQKIIGEYKQEIYHTEGMELVNAIKHEILGNRALTDQMKLNKQILDVEQQLNDEHKKDPKDIGRIESLERLMSSLSQAIEVNSKEYRESNKKLQECLKSLKMTRDQRLNRIIDSKKSFTEWMARIVSDKDLQRQFGQYSEKFKVAVEVEKLRLGSLHKYADNNLDRPIYNMETLEIESDVNNLDRKNDD